MVFPNLANMFCIVTSLAAVAIGASLVLTLYGNGSYLVMYYRLPAPALSLGETLHGHLEPQWKEHTMLSEAAFVGNRSKHRENTSPERQQRKISLAVPLGDSQKESLTTTLPVFPAQGPTFSAASTPTPPVATPKAITMGSRLSSILKSKGQPSD